MQIPPPVHVTFLDWLPGICSLLGMIVINLIDKDRVQGHEDFGDARAVWRARLLLFIGFALMAGGLAGSVVRLVRFVSGFVCSCLVDALRSVPAGAGAQQVRKKRKKREGN